MMHQFYWKNTSFMALSQRLRKYNTSIFFSISYIWAGQSEKGAYHIGQKHGSDEPACLCCLLKRYKDSRESSSQGQTFAHTWQVCTHIWKATTHIKQGSFFSWHGSFFVDFHLFLFRFYDPSRLFHSFWVNCFVCLFVLKFYGPVNEVMSSRSVDSGTVSGQA